MIRLGHGSASGNPGVLRLSGVLLGHIAKGQEVKMLGAKTFRFGFGATAFLYAVLCGGVLSAQEGQKARAYYAYYICAGDVLQISVYQHPELSKTVVVRSNGDINLPWLNAAKVAGLSVQAASDLLRQKLQSTVDKSCVTVTVKRRKWPLVLEKEPFFIDVPPPDQFHALKMRDS